MAHLTPAADATRLAEEMLAARDVMEAVLTETIESARSGDALESGRTVCGDTANIKLPFERSPKSVELRSCPVDLIGLYHTHPTPDQLRNPEHSLPDVANVALGPVDVSIIVGTHTSDVVLAPDDREAMHQTFRQSLGLDVSSTTEVVYALDQGIIEDPTEARERVREGMNGLITRQRTGFQSLDQQVDDLDLPSVAVSALEGYEHDHPEPDDRRQPRTPVGGPDAGKLRHRSRCVCDGVKGRAPSEIGGVDLRTLVISQTVGTLVGNVANEVIFKRFLGFGGG